MRWREQKDRFLFVGERLLNAFVTILYVFSIMGAVVVFGKGAFQSLGTDEDIPTANVITAFALVGIAGLLFLFSKYLERKHIELKEIVFGMNMLKGDLYRMQQNQNDPNYIPVLVKRGSLYPEEDLQNLIGLDNVRDKIDKLNALYVYEKGLSKKQRNASLDINRHYAFIGNPGTGKTTVARIFAGLLHKNKRIKRNIYVECTGNDLISEFAGDTKNRIAKIYYKAKNGVLFIDEAYVLAQAAERAPEALAQLLTYMENDPRTVVIFAGYRAEMEDFMAMNSGLSSRISQKLYFDNYTPQQLLQIFCKFAQTRNLEVSKEASNYLINVFSHKIAQDNEQPFSNGRYARNCFDLIYQQHAVNQRNSVYSDERNIISENDVRVLMKELLTLD